MSVQNLALSVCFVLCLVLVAGCAPVAAPPTATAAAAGGSSAETPDILQAYDEAFNQHDTAGVLPLFADDVMFYEDVGYLSTLSKKELGAYLEHQFGSGAVTRTSECAPDGDGWKCRILAHDDCIKVWGDGDIADADSNVKVTIKDGKIKSMWIRLIQAHVQLIDEKFPEFETWAEANEPELWKATDASYSRATGEALSKLCKAYLASQK